MNAIPLVVVIMVKNEEEAIARTLLPFVEGGVKHICVLDTGSTDSTLQVTKNFFETYDITGFIDQEPFVDFSTSRNRALELAENYFPNALFFMMPDADWYLQNVPKLIEFCKEQSSNSIPLYNIKVMLGQIEYFSSRLFRVSAKNRYVGVVHESPEVSATVSAPADIYFLHTITKKNQQQSKARYARDIELLTESFKKNPTNPRTLFYLAQTYECDLDFNNAYKFYLKRSRVKGWDEEDFITLYRLGYLAENLSQVDDAITWHTALDHYLKAFSIRRTRVDSLIKIAQHYVRENPQISFVYAQFACNAPYPKNDRLFIPHELYNFTRYDILSAVAWYMGEFAVGKHATEMALRANPENEILKQKLALYEAQIGNLALPSAAILSQVDSGNASMRT